jgi:hypothetical protein
MKTSTYDPCLLVIIAESGYFGLVGMQTDDTLGLSNSTFITRESDEMTFLAKDRQTLTEDEPLIFNGYILTIDGPHLRLKQKNQGQKLEAATDRKTYIKQRARGAYIATTCQLMASVDLSVAAQIPDSSKNDIVKLNRRIEWQKKNVNLGLSFVLIDLNIIKLYAMVNASFANNQNLSFQIGYVIVLRNETTENESFTVTENIVHQSFSKCKRITRNMLASEVYAIAHKINITIAIGTMITKIANRLGIARISIIICTNFLSFYKCLMKLETIKKKTNN